MTDSVRQLLFTIHEMNIIYTFVSYSNTISVHLIFIPLFAIASSVTGRKVRVKCEPDDTVGDLKKLVAAQTGTRPEKIRIQKSTIVYKDHITLE